MALSDTKGRVIGLTGLPNVFTVAEQMQPFSVDKYGRMLVSSLLTNGASQATKPFPTTAPFNVWTGATGGGGAAAVSATLAAGGAGVRNICIAFTAKISVFAALAAPVLFSIHDGPTSGDPFLYFTQLADANPNNLSGIALIGSVNTAMTVNIAAGYGATNFAACSIFAYRVLLDF